MEPERNRHRNPIRNEGRQNGTGTVLRCIDWHVLQQTKNNASTFHIQWLIFHFFTSLAAVKRIDSVMGRKQKVKRLLAAYALLQKVKKEEIMRRFAIHPIVKRRPTFGEFHHLYFAILGQWHGAEVSFANLSPWAFQCLQNCSRNVSSNLQSFGSKLPANLTLPAKLPAFGFFSFLTKGKDHGRKRTWTECRSEFKFSTHCSKIVPVMCLVYHQKITTICSDHNLYW